MYLVDDGLRLGENFEFLVFQLILTVLRVGTYFQNLEKCCGPSKRLLNLLSENSIS